MKASLLLLLMLLALAAISQPAHAQPAAQSQKTYSMTETAAVLTVAYVVTYILMRRKMISIALYRRVWNVALLISFLVSAVLGVLLVIRINYGLVVLQNFFALYYHVEAGISMAVITAFHLHIYRRYYTSMFRRGGKEE